MWAGADLKTWRAPAVRSWQCRSGLLLISVTLVKVCRTLMVLVYTRDLAHFRMHFRMTLWADSLEPVYRHASYFAVPVNAFFTATWRVSAHKSLIHSRMYCSCLTSGSSCRPLIWQFWHPVCCTCDFATWCVGAHESLAHSRTRTCDSWELERGVSETGFVLCH